VAGHEHREGGKDFVKVLLKSTLKLIKINPKEG